jgi:1-deoxy-D-xylulose-5-phosphate reductoisomerase
MTFPRRAPRVAPALCWKEARRLHFEPPDHERFPALRLGYEAARNGGSCGAVLNAANEAAVERFRAGRLGFGEITARVAEVLRRHRRHDAPRLADLMECDAWARQEVDACI